MDIEFMVKFVVKNAIDPDALREDFHNDPLEYIRFLCLEEGVIECAENEYEITSARILRPLEEFGPPAYFA